MTRPCAFWRACLLAACLIAVARANEPPAIQRVAVLDFENRSTLEATAVGYLADVVRSEARRALSAERSIVMTRDSILELLPPDTQLSECLGACAVDTGRRLGAHYVVTGQVVFFGGELRTILSLYDTGEANLLSMRRVGGDGPLALEAAVATAAAEMFAALPIAGQEEPARGQVVLELFSDPAGAAVFLDGLLLEAATPCTLTVIPGTHELALELADHLPWTETLHLAPTAGTLRLERALTPDYALLDVISSPPELAVTLDGRPIGLTPIEGFRVTPGRHSVRLADHRYHEMGDHVVITAGDARVVAFTPSPREGILAVRATDHDGDSVAASVTVDGRKRGNTPGRWALLVGDHHVELDHDGVRWRGRVDVAENAVETLDIKLPRAPEDRSPSYSRVGFDLAFDGATDPRPELPLYKDLSWGFSGSIWLRRSPNLAFGVVYGALSSGNHHVAEDGSEETPIKPFLLHRVGLGVKFHLLGDPSLYVHGFGALGFGQVALGAEALDDPPDVPDLYVPADVAGGTWIWGWGFGWEPGYDGRDDDGLSLFLEVGFNAVDLSLEYDDQMVWKEDGEVVYGERVTGEYSQFYRYTEWRVGLVYR